jgi:hypothetical protein
MEQYLRAYVNYLQDDWADWLPAAEFAANNRTSETTGVTPFYAIYGYHLRFGVELETPLPLMPSKWKLDTGEADEFARKMENLHEQLQQ